MRDRGTETPNPRSHCFSRAGHVAEEEQPDVGCAQKRMLRGAGHPRAPRPGAPQVRYQHHRRWCADSMVIKQRDVQRFGRDPSHEPTGVNRRPSLNRTLTLPLLSLNSNVPNGVWVRSPPPAPAFGHEYRRRLPTVALAEMGRPCLRTSLGCQAIRLDRAERAGYGRKSYERSWRRALCRSGPAPPFKKLRAARATSMAE